MEQPIVLLTYNIYLAKTGRTASIISSFSKQTSGRGGGYNHSYIKASQREVISNVNEMVYFHHIVP